MKIMLACRTLDNMAGGVERQIIALANEMIERGHEVSLFTWDNENAKAFYILNSHVEWIKLNLGDLYKKACWKLRLKRLLKMRKVVKNVKPDVIVAFQHGIFLALRIYTLGIHAPIIASTRNAPSILKFTSAGKHKTTIHQTLRMSKKITIQFKSYQSSYPTYLHDRMVTIPNAITPAKLYANPDHAHQNRWTLLAVGRFSFQKNFGVLIQAFASLSRDFPDWTLLIAGEGEQYEMLRKLVKSLSKSDTIKMPGTVTDINTLYAQSHIFCLPSLWEGFPNALSEALAHGLPAVGFADCAGINELIKDGENGFLVENKKTEENNAQSLAISLKKLMNDPNLRKNMGAKAIKSMAQYHPNQVFDIWEKVFKDTIR